MNFKLDENLPVDLVHLFRSAGHDASSVFDQGLSGEEDAVLLDICRNENRALITLDLDFADVRTYPPEENHGIIVLRLQRQDKPHVSEILMRLLLTLESEEVDKHLWIVEESKIRIRA